MAEQSFDPKLYEKPFWQPIGQSVIAFGYLEMGVNNAITNLLQIHHRQGEAVTSQILNLRARIQLIEKLCFLITPDTDHRHEVREIIKEIADLNTYRNGLLHGPWAAFVTVPQGEGYWSKLDVNPQNFKYREFRVKLSDLKPYTKRVIQARVRLDNFIQQVMKDRQKKAAPPSSRDKS